MATLSAMKKIHKVILAVIGISISVGLGVYTASHNTSGRDIHQQLKHATYLYDQHKAIADYILTDHNNNTFTPNSIKGIWTFWFFGFTHCPDICPVTLGTLSAVVNRIKSEHNNIKQDIKIVFVSVDPERDSTVKLKAYVTSFSDDAIGVTATDEQLAPFLKNMGVIATRLPAQNNSSEYLVNHSSSIFLIAPDTGISAVFSAPHNVEEITQDFLTIQKSYR